MKNSNSSIIPNMRYKNAAEAILWLCQVLDFTEHLVVPGENNSIAHAQLRFGSAMIMLSSENNSELSIHFKTPTALDGFNTQTAYLIVENIDAHYRNAVAQGAEIIRELRDEDYGGRGYTCRDPEGYLWHLGSYNPWQDSDN